MPDFKQQVRPKRWYLSAQLYSATPHYTITTDNQQDATIFIYLL